ncbi:MULTISPECIES: DUF2846 domain-containing protein [unclassified Pseudomonas]|uniref:DUF2846 domain-containing protein n=1 Tax=unclassified Pseudomonas TaxID=196821 RepID=UPI0021148321|nr:MULTISPECIES: DUF2846 domain-containing protein [unclassified Pseudomonas]
MNGFIKGLSALLLMTVLTACGHNKPSKPYFDPPPPPQGKALVYMMRTQVLQGSLYDSVFSINDSAVVALNDRNYSWVYVSPGLHKVSAGQQPNPRNVRLTLPVEAGKEYFVEYTQERSMEFIRVRKAEEGKAMVRGYGYLPVE